jgi:hypothetical protein
LAEIAKNSNHDIGFTSKMPLFGRKLAKITQNCDHDIGPWLQVQMLLLFLLVVSQLDFIIGSFLPAEDEKKFGFVGYSGEQGCQMFLGTTN